MGLPREGEGDVVPAFAMVEEAFNDDLGNANGAGISLRKAAIAKLTDLNTQSGWHDLVEGGLLFRPGVQKQLSASASPDDTEVWNEVYGHFVPHWDTDGWFPNIPHATFREVIGKGFLAALKDAESQAGGGQQLPIDMKWVPGDPDSGVTQLSVTHTTSADAVTIVISTPAPQHDAGA